MRELVGDHFGHALLHRERRGSLIEQQGHLAEGDCTGVLHGARLEVGHADLVELAVGVRLPEVVLEQRQHRLRAALRKGGEVLLARHGPGADGHAAHQLRLAPHKLADAERDQVTGERRRFLERHLPGAAFVRVLLDRAVADRTGTLGDLHRDLPARLESGLVEAGEHAARVGGLELRHRQRAGAVEAAQAGRELAAPRDLQHRIAFGQLAVERQRHGLAVGIGDQRAGAQRLASRAGAGTLEVELERMQRDLAARFGEPHFQLEAARERAGGELQREVSAIADRPHVEGKTEVLAESQGHGGPPG